MTIARVKSAGWATNETFTSAQANAVDINVTNAVDKRSGQTDTVQSVLTFSAANVHQGAETHSGNETHTGTETFSDIRPTTTDVYKYSSRSVNRKVVMAWNPGSTGVTINTSGEIVQSTTGATGQFDIDVPGNAVITGCALLIQPQSGHGGLPTQPSFKFYRINPTGFPTQIGGTAQDAQGTVGAYETDHSFGLTGLTEATDRTANIYRVWVSLEAGGNFIAFMKIKLFQVTLTVTQQDVAAA